MMNYCIVFDASSQDYTAWRAALPVTGFFIASTLLWILLSRKRQSGGMQRIRLYRTICKIVAISAAIGASVVTLGNTVELELAGRHSH